MRVLWLAGAVMSVTVAEMPSATPRHIDDVSLHAGLDFPIAPEMRWPIQIKPHSSAAPQKPRQELNTLGDIFAALRRCYQPPRLDQALPGMRITVQFSYTRDGELFGKPRILYETPSASPEQQSAYRMAVAAALARCSPLPFSKSLGNAVAGRVFAIQFVDERNLRGAERAGIAPI